VIDRRDDEAYAYLAVRLDPADLGRYRRLHPTAGA
jgi:hypothetical protein